MNVHVTKFIGQVPIAHRVDVIKPDICMAVAEEVHTSPFVKLRRRSLHILNDDALAFRNAAKRLHSNDFRLRVHSFPLGCLVEAF